MENKKLILYIDVDDTIINTAETFINYYCKKNSINKTIQNLKDWNFKSIDRRMPLGVFNEYIESDDFFNSVKINEIFLDFYEKNKDKYIWNFLTVGTYDNIIRKRILLIDNLVDFDKYCSFEWCTQGKKEVEYNSDIGIQIDDNYENLHNSSKYKILIKNFLETDYNQINDAQENVYAVNDWNEIIQCIEFFDKELIRKEV